MSQIINDAVLKSALNGDFGPIRSVPKTDLHAHLVLSAPFASFKEISKGKIKSPPARFKNLEDFLEFVKAEFFAGLDNYARHFFHSHFYVMNPVFGAALKA